MPKKTMVKISDSETCLFGPRRVLATGYAPEEQALLCAMFLRELDKPLPVVFCVPEDGETPLEELFGRDACQLPGRESKMPRAMILGGVTEKELRHIMAAWKALGLGRQLWAALTPVSEKWTLRELIRELQREHVQMRQKSRQ